MSSPRPSMQFVDLKAQYRAIQADVEARMQAVLEHGQYILGPEVAELESRLAARVGVRHCVSCSSGTDALLLALLALGIGAGDEVITTPFTFFATGEMIALLGAVPVMVDIEPDTYNLDPSLIEPAITARTKAILPVSLYGQPAAMDEINQVAARHGLPVIEDAAQSFGATWNGRASCGLSTVGCTSFFPSKPLGAYGDGGACFTDDDELAVAMQQLRNHGQQQRYRHTRIGINGRLDTLQAAILLAKLAIFDTELIARDQAAQAYTRALSGTVETPAVRPGNTSAWAQYTIEVNDREAVAAALAAEGVPTAVHYPLPMHQQPVFAALGKPAGSLPVAERAAARVLSLPMHPYLSQQDMDRVTQALSRAVQLAPAARD
ncbi:MAG TPA: DegT/DnrJ/EryC1/StrS family aminotransferase [Acidobacteriaceae bacterium]